MEKVIKFRKPEFLEAITHVNRLRYLIEDFRKAHALFSDQTEMPALTPSLLQEVLISGSAVRITGEIDSFVEKYPKLMQSTMLEGCHKHLNDILVPVIKKIESWKEKAHPKFDDAGIFEVSDDFKLPESDLLEERLRPLFEIKISSDLDNQLLDRYEALANSYNELMELAQQNDVRIPQQFSDLFRTMGMLHVPRVKPCPEVFLPSQTNKVMKERFGPGGRG